MKRILRTDDDWKKVHGHTETEFRRMFDRDLRGILADPKGYKCKLKIWVRYVGSVPFYDFQLRSPHRKLHSIRASVNEWKELSVRTLGDTPLDKGGKTSEQIWMDLHYVLRDFPGKRDLQFTLKSPKLETTAQDSRFMIQGYNPETNYDAITRQMIMDELNQRFGWEPKSRRIKKRELVDIWLEAVNTEGKSLDLEEEIQNE